MRAHRPATKKATSKPAWSTRTPPKIGPISKENLVDPPIIAKARPRTEPSTRLVTYVWRDSRSAARDAPATARKTIRASAAAVTPRTAVERAIARSATTMVAFSETRAIAAPAGSPPRRAPIPVAPSTTPARSSENPTSVRYSGRTGINMPHEICAAMTGR